MPNRHRLILSTNPNEATLRERAKALARKIDPDAHVDFLFDRRKNLAFVTIKTPTDEDVTFAQLLGLISEIDSEADDGTKMDPANIYVIGPININVPDEDQAS